MLANSTFPYKDIIDWKGNLYVYLRDITHYTYCYHFNNLMV